MERYVIYIVYFLGILVGVIVSKIFQKFRTVGTFRIDISNPENIKCMLVMDKDLEFSAKHKHIVLNVDKSYIKS